MIEEDEPFWRDMIGDKIICSECKSRNKHAFTFGIWHPGAGADQVWIRCNNCKHSGNYTPSEDEVRIFETWAQKSLEKHMVEKYGENPPITNIKVESVWHDDGNK